MISTISLRSHSTWLLCRRGHLLGTTLCFQCQCLSIPRTKASLPACVPSRPVDGWGWILALYHPADLTPLRTGSILQARLGRWGSCVLFPCLPSLQSLLLLTSLLTEFPLPAWDFSPRSLHPVQDTSVGNGNGDSPTAQPVALLPVRTGAMCHVVAFESAWEGSFKGLTQILALFKCYH